MKRTAHSALRDWKNNKSHKPLLLVGPRMVGKTWLAKEFGKEEYESVAYFNLTESPLVKTVFDNDPEPQQVLLKISSLARFDIIPGKTLVIIDDVHSYPKALAVLSEFAEAGGGYDLLACGFGANMDRYKANFEVVQLRPMSFPEFLLASKSIHPSHEKRNDLLKQYIFTGGFPSVVSAYVEGAGPHHLREIQLNIIEAIEKDIFLEAPKAHIDEILSLFRQAPVQICQPNQKFMFSNLKHGAKQKNYASSINWLLDAGLIYKINKVSTVSMPLSFYQDPRSFKLFPVDTGLTAAALDIDPSRLLVGEEAFVGFEGGLVDTYVMSNLAGLDVPICHYAQTGSLVNIDFVIQLQSRVVPLEVLPLPDGNAKALRRFAGNNPGRKCVRASLKPYFDMGWMENVPLHGIIEYLSKI